MSTYKPGDVFTVDPTAEQPLEEPQGDLVTNETEPQYATKSDLERSMAQLGQQLERKLQSMTDKQEHRLTKRISERLQPIEEYYRSTGREVPQGIKDQIELEELIASKPQETAEVPADIQLALDMRGRLERIYGTTLTEKDPEYAKVSWMAHNATEHVDSYEAALKAKAARLQTKRAEEPENTSPPNPARAPIVGSGAPTGGESIEQMTVRLSSLQAKPNRTKADWEEMKKLEGAIIAHLK